MKRIEDLNLSHTLNKKDYKKQLKHLHFMLLAIQQILYKHKIGLVIAFEGMDAAGKGGAIKRLTQKLDPRGLSVHPISAPQPHEMRYHYLHRFWRKLPQHGQISIFDRSWYGRVFVERIEGFATEKEWQRAYDEINAFEKTLTDENYILLKFWIHIDKNEQLSRFQERQNNVYKQWKLTDEDWRNREKFDDYIVAANEAFEKTNTLFAPWVLVPGNNKYYARIHVLKETINWVTKELNRRGIAVFNNDEIEENHLPTD